jgi:hypothetical protein
VLVAFLDRFRAPTTETVPLAEHAALANQVEILEEALGDGLAALRREDLGWTRVGGDSADLLTRSELIELHKVCLVAYVKAPLIGRGVRIRKNYVWGSGLEIAARDASEEGDAHPVNDLLQALLDSDEWKRTLGSAQAREEREVNLHTAGEFFLLAVHVDRGLVRPRLVPAAQVTDFIHNPDDPNDVWLYKRTWTTRRTDLRFPGADRRVATPQTVTQTTWHPTLTYSRSLPLRQRVDLIGADPVRWDQPIQHCAVNSVGQAPWGIPTLYAAIDWDRAYAEYLSGWAGLMKALARFAFKATAPAKHTAKVANALRRGQSTDPITGTPTDPVGATALMTPDANLAPMHSSGATIDSGSGKPLAGMVAAALDVPITMLLADPGITGARATAETLDKPLEETTKASRELWTDWLKAFFDHVIAVAVEDGALPADADGTVDVAFPPITDMPLSDRLDALQRALDAGAPPLLILRLMLEAIGVEDVDEVIEELTDENGDFRDPRMRATATAVRRERDGADGSQAAEAYRSQRTLVDAITSKLTEAAAPPVVNVTVPANRGTSRIERDGDGNITAIVKE